MGDNPERIKKATSEESWIWIIIISVFSIIKNTECFVVMETIITNTNIAFRKKKGKGDGSVLRECV